MKVLIITYYWPPSGGSGVQRWLKFVKYLPSFGVKPFVFTPQNPSFDLRDESLLLDVPDEAEVLHFPIWEPYHLGTKLSPKPKPNVMHGSASSEGFIKKIVTWMRGNLLFPDPRIFWVKPSVQFLEAFIRENSIEILITTGPPHSVHLIGLGLKKKNNNLKCIADFRDPWSEWGMLLSFKLTSWARSIHRRMEKQVLQKADQVVTITPFYVRQLERLSGRQVDLITNGYDESDFVDLKFYPTKKFLIRHVGLVSPACDPKPFLMALKELLLGDTELMESVEINFTGSVNSMVSQFILADEALSRVVRFADNVPHQELIKLYGQSNALLLILTGYKDGEGFLPGKLFEYLATGLPIVAIGPVPSDANELLLKCNREEMIASHNVELIKRRIKSSYQDWKLGQPVSKPVVADLYSRKQLTFKLVELLKSL